MTEGPGPTSIFNLKWHSKRLIARGTHADVNLVVTDKDIECIAKTIRLPLQLGNPEILKKLDRAFEKEKQLCRLKHENIIKFYDMAQMPRESSVVVFMEHFEGSTLDKRIGSKAMSEDIIGILAKQILSALHYLHTFEHTPVIHRDVNCRTIMVSEDNKVKLIDFGLAVQLLDSTTEHVSTDPRGDPCFMAPELFLCENMEQTPYSCASDIWAFGCVVYQMASGDRPHADCRNMLAIVRRVQIKGAPEFPEFCSDNLKRFYRKCTDFEREERWSAAKLLRHEFLSERESPSLQNIQRENESTAQTLPQQVPDLQVDASQLQPASIVEPLHDDPQLDAPLLRNLCLIINVEEYEDKNLFPSHNAEKQKRDVLRVKTLFKKLKYKVDVLSEKGTKIWSTLSEIAQRSIYESFVCIIMAYGASNTIYASDGAEIEIRDIVARFRASQCPGLQGKPKLFFILMEKLQQSEKEQQSLCDESAFKLREKDFLLCSAMREKDASLVQVLCNVIEDDKFRYERVETIVDEVNEQLGLRKLRKDQKFRDCTSVSSLGQAFFLDFKTPKETLEPDVGSYSLKSPRKGLCLVINVDNYASDTKFPVLTNQKDEAKSVEELFETLKFTVKVPSGATGTEIWSSLNDIVQAPDTSSYDSFICTIIAYGASNAFYASNGEEIEIEKILTRFAATQCPGLLGKPKLFFIQKERMPTGTEQQSHDKESPIKLHEKDFLLCSATRMQDRGLSLAQALHSVMEDPKFRFQSVEVIVTELDKRLNPIIAESEQKFSNFTSVSSLSMQLYFGPIPPFIKTWEDIKPLLGRGAFGKVVKIHTDRNITCCAKYIYPSMQLGDKQEELDEKMHKFSRREMNLCNMEHPNIVKFIYLKQEKTHIVIFLEILTGVTLKNRIDNTPMDENDIACFGKQICSALVYMHDQSPPIIHGDLSPNNIMVLTGGNQIKIVDFGLSTRLKKMNTHHTTRNCVGTYVAPEQLGFENESSENPILGRETDIWAFGCTVYNMSTGTCPHSDCTKIVVLAQLLEKEGPPTLPETCSEKLRNFYNHCVKMKRHDRKSARDLLRHEFLS